MKEIRFKEEGQYLGRNGYGKAIGMELSKTPSENFIALRPINSKNKIGSCIIYVPVESVSELIEALKNYEVKPVMAERDNKIKYIKDVLAVWGSTSCMECDRDHSPCKSSIGNGKSNVSELIEQFDAQGVSAVTYNDEIEIGWNDYTYEELSDDLIDEIHEIIEEYEADMLKTEKRCQD